MDTRERKEVRVNYIIRYSNRRSISMKFNSDGDLLVAAPRGVPQKFVTDFIESKKSWIMKNLKLIQSNKAILDEVGYFTEDELKDIRKRAKEIIPGRVEYYAKKGGFKYNKIFFKLMRTQWGSCSGKKNLNFNLLLAAMPLSIIDSVVVHELCHLRHMDHSSFFYEEVYKLCPNYDECHKWLKREGSKYLVRVRPN